MILFRLTVLALGLTLAVPSFAVMLPEKVKKELGLENHLQKKTLAEHIDELKDLVARIHFRVPQQRTYFHVTSDFASASDEIKSRIVLSALFNSLFANLDPESFVRYRNIFYGYDSNAITWGLKTNPTTNPLNAFYVIDGFDRKTFKIQLAPELKKAPIWAQAVRLAALMEMDLRLDMIERLNAKDSYHIVYPKIEVVVQIYSSLMIADLANRVSYEVLQNELHDISVSNGPGEAQQTLMILLDLLASSDLNSWMMVSTNLLQINNPESTDALNAFTADLFGHIQGLSQMGNWSDVDELKLARKMESAIKQDWKRLPSEKRLRRTLEAQQMKDLFLDSIIRSESIVLPQICEQFLN